MIAFGVNLLSTWTYILGYAIVQNICYVQAEVKEIIKQYYAIR